MCSVRSKEVYKMAKDNMFQYVSLEYSAMREEVKTSYSQIFLTVQISIAFIGVLFVAACDHIDSEALSNLIFCILIPIISATAINFIIAESIRMQRAGIYMCILEKKCEKQGKLTKKQKLLVLEEEKKYLGTCSGSEIVQPLAFERWIRTLQDNKNFYGRSGFMFQFRFIIFFIVAVISYMFALGYQFFNRDKGVFVFKHYGIHIIGAIIAIPWFIFLIWQGFKLTQIPKKKCKIIIIGIIILIILLGGIFGIIAK